MTQLLVACGYVLLGYVIGRACMRAYQAGPPVEPEKDDERV